MIDIADDGFVVVLARSYVEAMEALEKDVFVVAYHFGEAMYWKDVVEMMSRSHGLHVVVTMNPVVLNHVWLKSAEDVRRRFLLVQGGDLVNMSVREAEGVFQDYKVNIQSTSEILICRGLW